MSEFLNHEIWVSTGGKGGKARGTVTSKKQSMRRLHRAFETPSVDASITYAQYMKLGETKEGKQRQADKKAAAGFIIAGKFKDGRRKITHQIGRSAIQIDIDHATPAQAEFILVGFAELNEWGYLWHTTRAHCAQKPRIRILVPLKRMVNGDEANALTRLLALTLADDPAEAIEIPDLVSFRYNQIMYLPSISKGHDYDHGYNDAPVLDPDEFLAARPGWDDLTKLPRQEEEKTAEVSTGKTRMEDPTEKEGLIGAFCRAYTVEEAIEEFLPDVYVPGDCSTETRYTFTEGSAANGLVVYDDGLFAYSHHGTDPAEGQNNAWDLVRKHLFGDLDDEAHGNTSPGNMPSFKAMSEKVREDPKVAKERAAALSFDDDEFDDYGDDEDEDEDDSPGPDSDIDDLLSIDPEGEEDDLLSTDPEDEGEDTPSAAPKDKKKAEDEPPWQEKLVLDKADNPMKSRFNAALIVCNDKRIARGIAMNDLTGTPFVRKPLHFPKVPEASQSPVEDPVVGRRWTDVDTAALNICLSAPRTAKGYGLDFATQDLETAMLLAAQKNRYNPVLDMIHQTKWDGVERVGTTWVEFLGAPDTAYVRELEKLVFVAAIARLHEPGHPFHLVPIFGGKQGGGKTGYIKAIAFDSKFYGELSGDFHDTKAMVESTNGKWITEMPELKGTHRGQIQDIKQYFTAEKDTVRLAYRRNEEDFYRRNVTLGTTNEDEYLRDDENRRFCPVPVTVHKNNVMDFDRFIPLVPQLWAEAEQIYKEMRRQKPKGQLNLNFTSPEAREEAEERQTAARETLIHEPVAEVLEDWLNRPVSADAAAAGDPGVDEFEGDGEDGQMFVRNYVTSTLIRQELGQNPVIRDLKMSPDKVVGNALHHIEGWEHLGQCRRLGRRARWYVRSGHDNGQEFIPAADVGLDDHGKPLSDNLLD